MRGAEAITQLNAAQGIEQLNCKGATNVRSFDIRNGVRCRLEQRHVPLISSKKWGAKCVASPPGEQGRKVAKEEECGRFGMNEIEKKRPMDPTVARCLGTGSFRGVSAALPLRLRRRRPGLVPHTRRLPDLASNCRPKKGRGNVTDSCRWYPAGRRVRDCIAEAHAARS